MTVNVVVPDEIVEAFNEFKSALERDNVKLSLSVNVGPQQISTLTIESALDLFVACFGEWVLSQADMYRRWKVSRSTNVSDNPRVAALLDKIAQEKAAARQEQQK